MVGNVIREDGVGLLHVRMKVEIRVMFLQAKEHQRLPENHQKPREGWGRVSLTASEGTNPARTLVLHVQHHERTHFYS